MDLREAWTLAHDLCAEHGLVGWSVEFDQAKSRAGVCRHHHRVIGLSMPLTRLHPTAEVRDTILHEIAHALSGPEAGHGPEWLRVARRIGCSGLRCVPEGAPRVHGAWVGVCAKGHTTERHRRPERVLLCRACAGRALEERIFDWTHRGGPASMHPNYVHELRALMAGERLVRLQVGSVVRIVAPGRFHGRTGTVIKRGRTSYHVRVPEGVMRVVFAGVEPAP